MGPGLSALQRLEIGVKTVQDWTLSGVVQLPGGVVESGRVRVEERARKFLRPRQERLPQSKK